MFKKPSSLILMGAAGLAWLVAGAAAQEKAGKVDTLAKETTERFMKAMKAEDIEAVMKIVEVPFFWDGVRNIKDRKELKEALTEVFADKDLTQLNHTIKEIHTFAKALEKIREKDRELLKEVLDKDDRIVVVTTKSQGRQEGLAVMIRIREGKLKVAGFRD